MLNIVLHFLVLNIIGGSSGLLVALVILLLPSLRLGIISSLTHHTGNHLEEDQVEILR